jgi:regulator of protease activity HflC (stomatin/prohibitin superfamily)
MRTLIHSFGAALAAGLRALSRALVGASSLAVAALRGAGRALARGARSRGVRAAAAALLVALRVAALAAVFALLALGAGWFLFQRVPPGYHGVRQNDFGGGIESGDRAAGIHFAPRGFVTWHLVEKRTFVLDFAWESEGGDYPPIVVRTRDGNVCNLSVSLLYRVKPGQAHELVRDGLRTAFHQRVKATTEKIVLEEFGQLTSSEYADTEARLARCAATLERLAGPLSDVHVEVESLLVTQFLFAMEYEKKLQERQLLAQQALMNAAQSQLEQAREAIAVHEAQVDASEKRIRAEWDARIGERFAAGRRSIVALEQEAREYDRRRKVEAQAEHDRLVAQGERALLQARGLEELLEIELYDSEGGRIQLARRAAENLAFTRVQLDANDPRVPSLLDLDAMVKLLLGAEGAARP